MCKGHGIRELVKECNGVVCASGFKAVELLGGIVLAHDERTREWPCYAEDTEGEDCEGVWGGEIIVSLLCSSLNFGDGC
jgi:hypothetical protein